MKQAQPSLHAHKIEKSQSQLTVSSQPCVGRLWYIYSIIYYITFQRIINKYYVTNEPTSKTEVLENSTSTYKLKTFIFGLISNR